MRATLPVTTQRVGHIHGLPWMESLFLLLARHVLWGNPLQHRELQHGVVGRPAWPGFSLRRGRLVYMHARGWREHDTGRDVSEV